MIIPIKCFTCGKVIASKYRTYLAKVRELKLSAGQSVEKVIYLTQENRDKSGIRGKPGGAANIDIKDKKTPEGMVMDDLGIVKMCCRRHLLTHVDIE
jgi:DNA-directed RNA polymerase subunit N (RpoN/RPB10)